MSETSEIFNLHTLCRCCHKDGSFRSLQLAYVHEERVEVYSVMLQETFNINISPPPFEASFTICDQCIQNLRDASYFKEQVLKCEEKFEEYCKNEQALIKEEISDDDGDNNQTWSDAEIESNHNSEDKCELKPKTECDGQDVKEEPITQTVPVEFKPTENASKKKPSKKLKRNISKVKKKVKQKITLDPELEICIKRKNETQLICKLCGKNYANLKDLRPHISSAHPETVTCSFCSKVSRNRNTYYKHGLTHVLWDFTCRICKRSFSNNSALIEHMTIHMRTNKYQCDICDKVLSDRTALHRHLLWHEGKNITCVCDICGRGFNHRTNMKIHVQVTHLKLRPFLCTVCNETFKSYKYLKQHNIIHHMKEAPFQCETCNKRLCSAFQLKQHNLKHLGKAVVKVRSCKVCKETFDTRGKLMAHMKHHIGEKQYKCHLCTKDFFSKYTLNRHISTHSGVKAFQCKLCDAKFHQKMSLKRHEFRFHDPKRIVNEKVKCDICNKHYRDYDKHMNSHNKRPHTCEWCHKSYSERNILNRHIKHVHLDDKKFQCDLCGKKYTQVGRLKHHSMKVHSQHLKKEEETDL